MCNERTPNDQFYTSLVNVRNTELSVYWTRYNILAAVNLALLAIALASDSTSFMYNFPIWIMLGGIILAFIWLLITIKGKQLITNRWEEHIRDYEKAFKDKNQKLFTNVNTAENVKCFLKKHYDNLNIPARAVPIICIVGWLIIGFYFWPTTTKDAKHIKLEMALEKIENSINRQAVEMHALKNHLIGIESKLLKLSDLQKENIRDLKTAKDVGSPSINNDNSKMKNK